MMIISDSVKKMPKTFFSFDKCTRVLLLSLMSKVFQSYQKRHYIIIVIGAMQDSLNKVLRLMTGGSMVLYYLGCLS